MSHVTGQVRTTIALCTRCGMSGTDLAYHATRFPQEQGKGRGGDQEKHQREEEGWRGMQGNGEAEGRSEERREED
eukprot:3644916-Rhodomonas_salina.1